MDNKNKTPNRPQTNWMAEVAFRRVNKAAFDRAFDIALRIIDLMDAKGWKNADLAAALGISHQYVSKLRKGHEINLGQQLLLKLEEVLGGPIMEVVSTAELPVAAAAQKTVGLAPVQASVVYQQHIHYGDSTPLILSPPPAGGEKKKGKAAGSIQNAPFLMRYNHG